MCGRRKIEKDYPHLAKWGDMPLEMVELIAPQVPRGTVVQFHNNGEPLLYPHLAEALELFPHCIKALDTNGKLLMAKSMAVLQFLDILTVSVIPGQKLEFYHPGFRERHPESDEQYETVKRFIDMKGDNKPLMVYRLLGDIDRDLREKYENLPGIIATRALHQPMGSFGYQRKVTIPEIGMCQEILTHLAIDRFGDVSPCVRFDPERKAVWGNVKDLTLESIWNGPDRRRYVKAHMEGRRSELPLCSECEYWGVPVGSNL